MGKPNGGGSFKRLLGGGPSEPSVVLTATLLLLAAGLIRFWKLGAWSFWADEVFTLRDAQSLRNVISYPVGYALIGLAVRLFGTGEFAARLIPAVAGALTVPALYFLGKKLFSHRVGLISAALLALSCYHIYYSQYARYYTLLVLFGTLAMWAAFLGIERNNVKLLAAAVLLLLLAFLTHWTAALLLPALALTCLWFTRGEERPRGVCARSMLILFGPFLAGGLAIAPQLIGFVSQWGEEASFSIFRSGLLVLKLVDRIEPAVLICGAVGAWVLLIERDYRVKWLLPFALVPPAVVTVFVAFSKGGSRFAIVSVPAFVLLAGVGLDRLIFTAGRRHRKVGWVLVALVVFSLGLKDARYFTVERGQRPRWREAVDYVTKKHPGATVVAGTPAIFQHYSGSPARALAEMDAPSIRAALAPAENRPPIVFIVEHVANVRPTPEQLEAIQEHTTLEKSFPLHVRFLDYTISVYR